MKRADDSLSGKANGKQKAVEKVVVVDEVPKKIKGVSRVVNGDSTSRKLFQTARWEQGNFEMNKMSNNPVEKAQYSGRAMKVDDVSRSYLQFATNGDSWNKACIWEEVHPDQFERPCDSIERFYSILSGNGDDAMPQKNKYWSMRKAPSTERDVVERQWNPIAAARFTVNLPHAQIGPVLQHTWATMRYEHPELACFAVGQTKVYSVGRAESLNTKWLIKWLEETFITMENANVESLLTDLSAEHRFHFLHPQFVRPGSFSTCYYFPQSLEIAIVCSQWRIDGIGSLQLLDSFFSALANPREVNFGDEAQNLSPSLFTVTRVREDNHSLDENTLQTDRFVATLLSEAPDDRPSIGLPTNVLNNLPRETRRRGLILTPLTTAKIGHACESRNISLQAAIHAAIALSTYQLSLMTSTKPLDPPTKKYVSWCDIDLRHLCDDPHSKSAHAVTAYSASIPVALDPSEPLLSNASQLHNIYSLGWAAPHSRLLPMLDAYLKKLTATIRGLPEAQSLPTQPIFHSLGCVDGHIKRFHQGELEVKVEDFWLGVATRTKQPTIHFWVYEGRINLSVSYNTSYYTAATMDNFLKEVVYSMCTALNLQEHMTGIQQPPLAEKSATVRLIGLRRRWTPRGIAYYINHNDSTSLSFHPRPLVMQEVPKRKYKRTGGKRKVIPQSKTKDRERRWYQPLIAFNGMLFGQEHILGQIAQPGPPNPRESNKRLIPGQPSASTVLSTIPPPVLEEREQGMTPVYARYNFNGTDSTSQHNRPHARAAAPLGSVSTRGKASPLASKGHPAPTTSFGQA